MDFVGSEQLFYPKAENLGQFRQAIGGLSVGWRPNPIVRVTSMARVSWTREREESGTWKRLPQDVPLRLVTKLQWSPLTSLSLDITGDLLSERVLIDKISYVQNPVFFCMRGQSLRLVPDLSSP